MAIFAISDLHLSLGKPKPMDIFGESWRDHEKRIAENWDAIVAPDDTVLMAGDHSWALRFDEAAPDINYIAQRPGRKILIRGNHDYWWRRESTNKIQAQLPEGIELMHGRGIVVDNIGITGTRGWRIEEGEEPGKRDSASLVSGTCSRNAGNVKVMERELMYLERGLQEIPDGVDKKIVMLHYPPFSTSLEPNEFTQVLHKNRVDILIYGHIHSGGYLEGNIDGIEYHLVSVDHTGFRPVRIV